MSEILYITLLYDFYGELLTAHQQEVFQLYHFSDYSLQEISNKKNISRQAVSDLVRRTEKNLNDYEEKLHLVKKHREKNEIVREISTQLENIEKELEYDLQIEIDEMKKNIKTLIEK